MTKQFFVVTQGKVIGWSVYKMFAKSKWKIRRFKTKVCDIISKYMNTWKPIVINIDNIFTNFSLKELSFCHTL